MADANPQDSITLIRLQVVDAETQKTLSQIRLVKAELASIAPATTAGSGAAASSVKSVGTEASVAAAKVADLNRAASASAVPLPFDNLKTGLKSVKAEADAAKAAVAGVTTGAGGGSLADLLGGARNTTLGRAGALGRSLPSIQLGGGVSTDVISNLVRVLGVVESLSGSLVGVATVAAPVVLAVSGVALVLDQQRRAEEALKDAAEATIDAIQREADAKQVAAGAIATGSIAAVQQQLTKAQSDRETFLNDVYQPRIEAMQARSEVLRGDAERQARVNLDTAGVDLNIPENARLLAEETQRIFNNLLKSDAGLKARGNGENGQPSLEKLNEQLTTFDATIEQLSTTATGGAAVLQALNQPLKDQQQLRELEGKSSKQLAEQQKDNAADLVALNKQIANTEKERQAALADGDTVLAEVLRVQNSKNKADFEGLQHLQNLVAWALKLNLIRESEIGIREAEKRALDDFNRLSKSTVGGYKDVQSAQATLATAEANHADKMAQLAAKKTEVETEAADKAIEIQQKANDEAAALGEKYGIERKRAEEDLQRELSRLRRAEGQAIAARDVAAFESAREKTQDEKDQGRIEAQRRKEDYQRELRELAAQTQKQLDLNHRAAQKQLAAANAALSIEVQKSDREIAIRREALDIALKQYELFVQQLKAVNSNVTVENGVARQYITPNVVYASSYAEYQRSQGVPGFASGLDYVGREMVVKVHPGELIAKESLANDLRSRGISNRNERIIPASQNSGRPVIFNINGVGRSEYELMGAIGRGLRQVIRTY